MSPGRKSDKTRANGFIQLFGGRLLSFNYIANIARLRAAAAQLRKKVRKKQPLKEEIDRLQVEINGLLSQERPDTYRIARRQEKLRELLTNLEGMRG